MRIKPTTIGSAAIAVIVIMWLIGQYGLAPQADWSKPEAVAGAFMTAYSSLPGVNFFHRYDKLAYGFLSPEAKERLASYNDTLAEQLAKLAGGAPPPNKFDTRQFSEEGDQARVSFTWHYESAADQQKTIVLVKRDDKWLIYSII